MNRLAGIGCGYCGFMRDDRLQKAKVGGKGLYLEIRYEAGQKMGKLQLANVPYTLEVCPACGAIIDVLEMTI